jgi:pyruvate/2-oxoglutarate dehydrogenase complex dihydrolipoamide acyltransferase (E2) component
MAHAKSSNPNEFILPDLGEGVHEAELIKWRVKVGDTVAEHDILAEMETDKALVEVPSPRAGTISALHGNEGEVLNVGNVLVTYEGAGGAAEAAPRNAAPAASPSKNGSASHSSHSAAPKAEAKAAKAEPEAREDAGTVVGNMSGGIAGVTTTPGKALATPAVRRLARDLGVAIDAVTGTGIGGRVTEKDVRSAAAGPSSPALSAVRTAPSERHRPRLLRRRVPPRPRAARLRRRSPRGRTPAAFPSAMCVGPSPIASANPSTAPSTSTLWTRPMSPRSTRSARSSAPPAARRSASCPSSARPSPACPPERVPRHERDRRGRQRTPRSSSTASVHLGIATDTDSGLMVPVIRDCDRAGRARDRPADHRRRRGRPQPHHPARAAHGLDVHDQQRGQPRRAIRHADHQLSRGRHPRRRARASAGRPPRLVLRRQAPAAQPRLRSPRRGRRDRGPGPGEIVKLLQEHPDTLMGPARG